VRDLTPFFVTRQIFTGAGKVGVEGPHGEREVGFQLTQRADFFEAEVGLETTLKRPIINTRDEPHADPEKYRRLHCIIGDANMSEVATFLKIGTTAIVLKMIEDEFLPDFSIDSPVQSLHDVSWDLTCKQTVRLGDGRTISVIDLQWEYLDYAKKYVKEHDASASNADVVQRWESVLNGLEEDPFSMHRELDWAAKYRLMEGYRERDGLEWSDPKLRMIDLQYHDVRRDKSLYAKLAAGGKIERVATDAEIDHAIMNPPPDTRAFFRGNCIDRYPDAIVAASWDSLIFDTGADTLQRVPMREPLRGTADMVASLLEESPDAGTLVHKLQG
jgi:proteasome accessory factor A